MLCLSKFIEFFNLEIEKKKNFLIFLITGNKPLVSEIILSETIIKQIAAKNGNKIRSNILDILNDKKDEELIFFKFNKKKSNDKYILYDVCLFLNKNEKNLYIFKNFYENLNEELSEVKLKDFIFLKTENELQKKEIINNKFTKINNLSSVRNLVENFGFDWLYKKSFFMRNSGDKVSIKSNSSINKIVDHLQNMGALNGAVPSEMGNIARHFPQAGGLIIANWLAEKSLNNETFFD